MVLHEDSMAERVLFELQQNSLDDRMRIIMWTCTFIHYLYFISRSDWLSQTKTVSCYAELLAVAVAFLLAWLVIREFLDSSVFATSKATRPDMRRIRLVK